MRLYDDITVHGCRLYPLANKGKISVLTICSYKYLFSIYFDYLYTKSITNSFEYFFSQLCYCSCSVFYFYHIQPVSEHELKAHSFPPVRQRRLTNKLSVSFLDSCKAVYCNYPRSARARRVCSAYIDKSCSLLAAFYKVSLCRSHKQLISSIAPAYPARKQRIHTCGKR